ncbi:hypothetical protein Q8W71_24200 [Methylobacterium sp. NEAU 140]|uniref:hypothetical protein n=1 Tax=Methylobacterium sp. NEAU 140 TaxID=3064945 RepID=UPI0027371055|nr:hypothetical protein [Methylobacterium sp. NEAU 140]MDP4025738.1 hypothetical protein [Methylobacterium sp. NEAU 140]
MRKLLAITVMMLACTAPALAQADRLDRACDPQTTGSLHVGPQGPHPMGARTDKIEVTPPEESWQEEAQEEAERRRQHLIECGVD